MALGPAAASPPPLTARLARIIVLEPRDAYPGDPSPADVGKTWQNPQSATVGRHTPRIH
jgi:hypothetical protein